MTAAIARIRDFFFELATGSPARSARTVVADRVAVLGRGDRVDAAAAAVAMRAVRERGGGCALIARWGVGGRSWRAPATRAASRASTVLHAVDLPVVTSGRLVRLDLAGEAPSVERDLERAAELFAGPIVLAVGAARDEAVDRVLARHDELLLVGDGAVLLDRLAAASLAALGRPVRLVAPAGRAGLLAALGIAGGASAPPAREGMG